MNYEIKRSRLSKELEKKIIKGFGVHSKQVTGENRCGNEAQAFELTQNGKFVGAIAANSFWGGLHIKYFFIEEEYRGKGFGRILMEKILEFGREEGCKLAFVETMSFQAPEFYPKFGFKIDFVRKGYDAGASFYYFSKDLG